MIGHTVLRPTENASNGSLSRCMCEMSRRPSCIAGLTVYYFFKKICLFKMSFCKISFWIHTSDTFFSLETKIDRSGSCGDPGTTVISYSSIANKLMLQLFLLLETLRSSSAVGRCSLPAMFFALCGKRTLEMNDVCRLLRLVRHRHNVHRVFQNKMSHGLLGAVLSMFSSWTACVFAYTRCSRVVTCQDCVHDPKCAVCAVVCELLQFSYGRLLLR